MVPDTRIELPSMFPSKATTAEFAFTRLRAQIQKKTVSGENERPYVNTKSFAPSTIRMSCLSRITRNTNSARLFCFDMPIRTPFGLTTTLLRIVTS